MIGLGSNRLTVCRRGGMSVTQAGKGGMEWLAGWRRPSWATPYSAQATAALKAQFSLEQWPTIRDYGFAHPEIVPYVNEDYLFVCSLGLPGMPIRWMTSDGTAYIDADLNPYFGLCGSVRLKISNTSVYTVAFGTHTPYFAPVRTTSSAQWLINMNASNMSAGSFTANRDYLVEFTTKNGDQKVKVDGVQTLALTASSVTINKPMYIFLMNREGAYGNTPGPIAFIYLYDGTTQADVARFVPCIHNGVNGMYDIVRKRWFGNAAGSGSFSITYTLPDGTPWTPSTP